jgi:hypothetical protein
MEDWVVIPEFPEYSVSNLGRVRRNSSGRILSVRVNQYGVPYVGLMKTWYQHERSLALLVAKVFLPPTNEIFNTPINLDGNRLNCAADNLMWRPRAFAVRYNQQFTQEWHSEPLSGPVRCRDTGEVFQSSRDAACRYGVLEMDLIQSIMYRTVTWPNYMSFEFLDKTDIESR